MENLITRENIETAFLYHAPSPEQIKEIRTIRWSAKKLAEIILETVDDSMPQKQIALYHLNECMLNAVQSIENKRA